MGYRIISNSEKKHGQEIKRLISRCSMVVIASPFISEEAVDFLANCKLDRLEKFTLITTMKPKDGDQLKKVPILIELCSLLQGKSFSICIDNALHGKVYIGKQGNQFIGAIISSANFTGNGLSRNHEWGVYIDEQQEIENLHNQLMKDTTRSLSLADLNRMKTWMDTHKIAPVHKSKTDLNILDLVSPPVNPVTRDSVTYWLKPYGTIDSPIPETMTFGYDTFNVTFAKGVKNIKEGDVLVLYAVGSKKILSIFVSTGVWNKLTTFNTARDKRWPYYVVCDNLTPLFGADWSRKNLTLDFLKDDYIRLNPEKYVRPGYKDFNILKWRLDRVKLEREFTEYVIDEVIKRQ